MSDGSTPEKKAQERIAQRARKISMLVHANRAPEKKDEIRKDFKRKEKLSSMRKKITERRSRRRP